MNQEELIFGTYGKIKKLLERPGIATYFKVGHLSWTGLVCLQK